MARTPLLLAGLVAAVLTAPLASAETHVTVRVPETEAYLGDEIVVGGFCYVSAVCVESYFCVERLAFCCPKLPPGIDSKYVRCYEV